MIHGSNESIDRWNDPWIESVDRIEIELIPDHGPQYASRSMVEILDHNVSAEIICLDVDAIIYILLVIACSMLPSPPQTADSIVLYIICMYTHPLDCRR
jgi:hypothetical protein